jgi:hypothetical protein
MAAIELIYDPTENYLHVQNEDIDEAIDILVVWSTAIKPTYVPDTDIFLTNMKKGLEDNYTYFAGWSEKNDNWDIDENLVFNYQDLDGRDPPQYPLAYLSSYNEIVIFYKYNIVAVIDKETNTKLYSRFN